LSAEPSLDAATAAPPFSSLVLTINIRIFYYV